MNPKWQKLASLAQEIQKVFYVYLNRFENAITHLFLVILDNN